MRPPLWPDAALVVAEHDVAEVGELARELREQRNAGAMVRRGRPVPIRERARRPDDAAGPARPAWSSVPARLKPAAGIRTSASVGFRTVCCRVATPARSCRVDRQRAGSNSSFAKPIAIVHRDFRVSGPPGSAKITEKRRVAQRAGRRLISDGSDARDVQPNLRLRRDVDRDSPPAAVWTSADGERFVGGEEIVGQDDGPRRDLIVLRIGDASSA